MISTASLASPPTSIRNAISTTHTHSRFTSVRPQTVRRVAPVINQQANGVAAAGLKEMDKSLADRIRLGSLTEDGLSYKERFIIRCYEVGINKTATVETIANLLQVILLCCFMLSVSVYDC